MINNPCSKLQPHTRKYTRLLPIYTLKHTSTHTYLATRVLHTHAHIIQTHLHARNAHIHTYTHEFSIFATHAHVTHALLQYTHSTGALVCTQYPRNRRTRVYTQHTHTHTFTQGTYTFARWSVATRRVGPAIRFVRRETSVRRTRRRRRNGGRRERRSPA